MPNAFNISDDTLSFTDNAIRIADIPITILRHNATYLFSDKNQNNFIIDLTQKMLQLSALNFQWLQENTALSLEEHLQDLQDHNNFNNTNLIPISNFPLHDSTNKPYLAYVHYSLPKKTYLYTQNLDKEFNDGVQIIYHNQDSVYFFQPKLNLLWRSDKQSHQLINHYRLFSQFSHPLFSTETHYISMGINSISIVANNTLRTYALTK